MEAIAHKAAAGGDFCVPYGLYGSRGEHEAIDRAWGQRVACLLFFSLLNVLYAKHRAGTTDS